MGRWRIGPLMFVAVLAVALPVRAEPRFAPTDAGDPPPPIEELQYAESEDAAPEVGVPSVVPEGGYFDDNGYDYAMDSGGGMAPPPDDVWRSPRRSHFLFRSSSNSPRFTGHGDPLLGSSWLNRPFNFSMLVGPIFNDDLVSGSIGQRSSVLFGFRFGWDFDHYWGTELRFAWSGADLDGPQTTENSDIFFSDLSLLYYPWGDSRWRPYLLAGVGMANYDFVDYTLAGTETVMLGVPLGFGLKYQLNPHTVFRVEVLDNFALANDGVDTMHNLSLTVNLEFHCGGTRKLYYPWQPNRHIK